MPATIKAMAIRPELSKFEEEIWCELIERRCGTCFSESRLYVLSNCLWREMQRLGIGNYGAYYRLVAQSAGEWDRLVDRLVNHETQFFRHVPSFTALSEELLPAIMEKRLRQGANRVALWSAGCSSGEEAYSLAISASEAAGAGPCEFDVTGSDLSSEALSVARRARYGERAVAAVPEEFRRRYLFKDGSEYQLKAPIKDMVRFEPFNLFDPSTYPTGAQDVIFCHNLFIYFREPMRLLAATNLAGHLRPGGFLLCAPGELSGTPILGLECVRLRHTVVLRRTGSPLSDCFDAREVSGERKYA